MKAFIVLLVLAFSSMTFAAEPAKKEDKPNCVTKDKKGNCPPAPKGTKPTPKKKVEEKK